ncbi:histidine kinase [Verrucomicrobiaceae bacterium 227]
MARQLLVPLVWALLCTIHATAEPNKSLVPYEADAFTLHLWHFDEIKPPFLDAGSSPTPLQGLLNGAKASQPAHPNLGHSISFHDNLGGDPGSWSLQGAALAEAPALSNGPDDRAPSSLRHRGDDGAFTYEALVKLELPPDEAEVIALTIISMDGEEEERIFNFRIERQGFLAFTPLIDSGAKGGAIATLPRTGPHALNTTDWFHVAVTYSGEENIPNNLRLYWTRIDSKAKSANLIGTGSLSHDFDPDRRGDFVIGNEGRTSLPQNAEAEPFPGFIDEVRISGVARHPRDFLFVPPDQRLSPEDAKAVAISTRPTGPLKLDLVKIIIDGEQVSLPDPPGSPLVLSSGLHRLDFDLSFSPEQTDHSVKLRTQLDGMDDAWRNAALGMSLFFDVLDAEGRVISQARSVAGGSSPGWANQPEESLFTERSEPLFIPHAATALRITLDSGTPDTTGSFVIDDLEIVLPGAPGTSLWPNPNFSKGINLTSAAGVPEGWTRGGDDPAIAQLAFPGSQRSLAVVDGDQRHSGNWSAVIPLDPSLHSGKTLATRWKEIYNVNPGSLHRASYVNVPAGSYTFRAIWLSDRDTVSSGGVDLPIKILSPVWERPWFWPLIAAGTVGLVALIIIREVRRINRRKLRQMWLQNALERDRTRIARDMHDDLGTRVSVLNINASLIKHELSRDPEKAQRHLDKLDTSARELVVAMNDLVWAVDPSHDSLDDLATHLTRLTEDLFGDGPIRYSLDIPAKLPDHQLGSDFRHHISLAVKEALNNVLKHAGPCEVHLSLACREATLEIKIRDNGSGFIPYQLPTAHHGLRNLTTRLEALGGTCEISSSPGKGTLIRFSCRILQEPTSTIP